ncbi:MAG: hypothetical protein IPJ19_00850 [Planctomycetes bacterium]|nr:hypothetical protein [Planctomycetota bacterium]
MPHVSATTIQLRPLDELGPASAGHPRGAHEERRRSAGVAGPVGVIEMLDLSIDLLRERFAVIVGLSVIAWLPVRALQPMIGAHTWDSGTNPFMLVGAGLSSVVNGMGAALAQFLCLALIARIVYAQLEGRTESLREAVVVVLRRVHVVVLVAMISALATGLGTLACFVPGIWFAWKLSVAPMACVIEGAGIGASMSRSFLLTRRGFWRWVLVALVSFCFGLPFAGLGQLLEYPGMHARVMAATGLSASALDLSWILVSSLMFGASVALRSCVLTVYYADCRMRREGSDLVAQQARLARAEAAS